jgi:sugar lactone lactonase YvrE
MKSIIIDKLRATGVFVLIPLLAFALAGCAAKKTGPSGPIFFPPPPDEPHVQYLTGITDSTDIEGNPAKFTLVLTGGEKAGTIRRYGKPYGMVAHKGKLYISDSGSKQVVIIDVANRKFEFIKGNLAKGALQKPVNLDVDDDGTIYVVDTGRKEIVVYDAAGYFVTSFGKNLEKAKLTSVAVSGPYLYVPDWNTSEIRVLDKKTGEQVNSLMKGDDKKTSVRLPTNIARDEAGFFYVSNMGTTNVMKFDRDGNLLMTVGKLGDSFREFARPRGIAVDHAGRIYVVDAGHGNVQLFDKGGHLLTFFGTPDPKLEAGTLTLPAGIAVESDNVGYYQKYAAPGFKLENIIYVINQYGSPTVSIYGLGEMEGSKKEPPKTEKIPADPKKGTEEKK